MGKDNNILTVNAGSSSVKLISFSGDLKQQVFRAEVTDIGQPNCTLKISLPNLEVQTYAVQAHNQAEATQAILDQLNEKFTRPSAIGHRLVHGGPNFNHPILITEQVIEILSEAIIFDPEHMPAEIELIRMFSQLFGDTPQVACFDTAFSQDMPAIAKLLPLPRKFSELGLRRYGFHGLSYEYLLTKFQEMAGELAKNGRVIMAHLGSGASLTALKGGKPLDTSMSFTPASGVLMSTRSGDLDPGIFAFLHQKLGMTAEEFNHIIYFESGLTGISGYSGDMELLIKESVNNPKAAEAVDLFCYQVRKTIGSFSAVLGGVDSLIFSGGIGQNSPVIREKICQGLEYLGITLDKSRNMNQEFLISGGDSRTGVHVIPTDEAVVIADQTLQTITKEGGY